MTDEPIPNADIDELIVAQWGDHQRPIKADLREFARRVLALPATRPSKDAAASHSQAPAEPLSYDRIAEAWHKLTGGFDHPTDDFEAGFRTAVRAQAPAASPPPTEPIATVIKRHSFVTGQDRYLIEPHAGVDLSEFAHQQLFPRAALTSTVAAASPESAWVSVDVQLPPKFTEVLVAFKDCSLPACAQYTDNRSDIDGWCYPKENHGDGFDWTITHWMPLPELPERAASTGGEAK